MQCSLNNNPVNRSDASGFMSGAACLRYLSLSSMLYATIGQITTYVTSTLLPILATTLWWAPYAIAGVIVAAIAVVVIWQVTEQKKILKAKGDTKQTGNVTKGMTKRQRKEYSKEVHRRKKKSGRGGKDNLPWEILKEIADEIRETYD